MAKHNKDVKKKTNSFQKENRHKNLNNHNLEDGITLSKQLQIKKKNRRTKRHGSRCKEPRVCPNGKPIPSLADLEKMFDDSDEDTAPTNESKNPPVGRSSTPEPLIIPEDKLMSPTTINRISERMLEMVSNISDPIELLDVSPVDPTRKRKMSEIHIVGYKDPIQDYGSYATYNEDGAPSKRHKKSRIPKFSKSIFNAKSDEIAANLKINEADGNDSSDSNKTIEYEMTTSCNYTNGRAPAFSPLPSTSRDDETFKKNDELFNESIQKCNNLSKLEHNDSDTEIIETPCETIVIDDKMGDEESQVPTVINDVNDDCIEIVETTEKSSLTKNNGIHSEHKISDIQNDNKTSSELESITILDDEYSEIEFNAPDNSPHVDNDEVIDIDELIAQNQSIIQKYKKDSINIVTDVSGTSTNPIKLIEETNDLEIVHIQSSKVNSQPNSNNTTNIQENNIIENVVTNFFKRRESNTIDHNKEIIDVEQQYQRQSPFNNTITQICNNENVKKALTFLNFVLSSTNISTPHNAVIELPVIPTTSKNNTVMNPQPSQNIHFPVQQSNVPPQTENLYRNQIESSSTFSNRQLSTNNISSVSVPEPATNSVTKSIGDCPICIDSLANNAIASTICGHVFCLKCIQAAIKANGKRCPTCRKVLKGKDGYHQLYL